MISTVLFDVDGVLLDSFSANYTFFKKLAERAGYVPFSEQEYRQLFHQPLRHTIKAIVKSDDSVEINRVLGLIDFVDSPDALLAPHAQEVIKELAKKYTIGIVTSRVRKYVFEYPLSELKDYFQVAIVYEDVENHKPHSDPLILATRELSVGVDECVYIGDVQTDYEAAKACGMTFIYFTSEALDTDVPVTSSFLDLPGIIAGM